MMKKCSILRDDEILFTDIKIADGFFTRLIGLLRTKSLSDNQGMLLEKCNQVHTFGMKFSIDVVFLAKDGTVLYIIADMQKGKVSPIIKKADYVLELASGSCERYGIAIAQQLEIML